MTFMGQVIMDHFMPDGYTEDISYEIHFLRGNEALLKWIRYIKKNFVVKIGQNSSTIHYQSTLISISMLQANSKFARSFEAFL